MTEGDPDEGDDRPAEGDDHPADEGESLGEGVDRPEEVDHSEDVDHSEEDDHSEEGDHSEGVDYSEEFDYSEEVDHSGEVDHPGEADTAYPSGSAPPDPQTADAVGTGAGAPEDQEMPLAAHVEEMVRRLAAVIVVMAVVSAITFPFADRLINFLWFSFLPGSPAECAVRAAAAFPGNGTHVANAALSGPVDTVNVTVLNGTVGNTTVVNGTLLNGIVANGTVVNGTVVNGTVANGTLVNGTVMNGTVLNGTLANGTVANASLLNGTLIDATLANGTTLNGTITNGTLAPGLSGANAVACPHIYHPLSLVLARLKMASLTGFVVALPVFVYQTYLFMRPGLYPNERRYYLSSVPTSLVLAAIGIAFAYFLVLPLIFTYFLGYSQPVAAIAFGLSDTFDLILLMVGMFAFIFQIPLFVMLAIMMGVTSRRWLEERRLYFWFGFAGIAFLFSPDPTGMAPFIVALTMVVLFEGTLLLLRWVGR